MESNGKKYYLKYWWEDNVVGPMTFKDALLRQEISETPCDILKVVIDANGKEVR